MSLSLHQQAHYLLSKVTAVIEAILLTLLSLFSPLRLCLSCFSSLLFSSDRCQLQRVCGEASLVAGDPLG